MDRASASSPSTSPCVPHDPGQPFCVFSHAPGDVHFKKGAGERYQIEDPAIVLFRGRHRLYASSSRPKANYPVFTISGRKARAEFLTGPVGRGPFHIMWLAESPSLAIGLKAQDLGQSGARDRLVCRCELTTFHVI